VPPRPVGAVRRSFAPWNDPAAEPLIRIAGVSKRFGGTAAVEDLSLDIYPREFFSLLGPSGCGKTTLMRLLAGFETPDAGRIVLDGEDLAGVPPYRRPVNMMFQSYALFPHMTVEGNVAFGLRQDGLPRREIRSRVEEVLALVKLGALARRRPDQLSGGQRQRVALARCLAKRPKALLLDEPLGALDRQLRQDMQFELMDLQVDLKMTFVVVTHDQEEAMVLSDRIAVMEHGRIVQVGTPAEIYEFPSSRYVADFIGDINLLEGRVQAARAGAVRLASTEAGAELEAATELDLEPGQTVWLAVRPEKIRMAGPGEAPLSQAANRLAGEIWDIGYFGDWTIYRVRLATGKVVSVSRANQARFVERPLTWDDRVEIAFPADAGVVLTR